ncbi:NUDIX hydrolase, partial [Chloroflexota bacterium]
SKIVFDGQIVRLRVDTIRMPDGTEATREIVEHDEVVAVVAVDADDNALLVRQYRRPMDKELLEIPAGGIEGNEEPEETVRREMQEETGYLPQIVERLGGFYSAPGFCNEYLYLYLATDLVPSQLHAEDTDEITLLRVPLDEIPGLITSGSICDAKSIAGLLTYLEYRKTD